MTTLPPRDDDEALAQALSASRLLEDAPASLVEAAVGLWQPRPRRAARTGLLQRVAAVLTFDSGAASPLAYGLRSGGSAQRQLLYSIEGCDIDLRIAPQDAGRYTLSGQVLGPDALGVVVIEPVQGGEAVEVLLSDLGEFTLPAVAAGDWRVTLQLTDRTIELPPVEVPTPR